MSLLLDVGLVFDASGHGFRPNHKRMVRGHRSARGAGREDALGSAGISCEVVILEHTEADACICFDDGTEDFYGRSAARHTDPNRVVDIVVEYSEAFAEFRSEGFHDFGADWHENPADLARARSPIYIYDRLDEPTTGLHFDDVSKLLSAFRRLIEAGGSIVVIEHNLEVIKTADWVIDLGPEGGERGGNIVGAGPPEVIAELKNSYTGQYLKSVLNGNGSKSV